MSMRLAQWLSKADQWIRFRRVAALVGCLSVTTPLLLYADVTDVAISASPPSVAAGGGTTTITALITDDRGTPVAGVPVTFSTDRGSLNATTAATDSTGAARVLLTTNQLSRVTARTGETPAVRVAASGGSASVTVGVAAPPKVVVSSAVAEAVPGTPVPLSITAAPGEGQTIVSILVSYGDGRGDSLPGTATSAAHAYAVPGVYTISVVATDSAGASGTAATVIVIRESATPPVAETPLG
jgi:adhesin/invasin